MKSKPKSPRGAVLPARPGPRLWFFRLTALLLPLLLLAALEVGLRLGGYGFDPHFFKPLKIGTENFLVENDDFSFSFFPRETARNPGELRMKAVKPPGTVRIFIFGESAAMGDPEPAYGPARYLEAELRGKYPDTTFEIVNVAFTAINSHVIVPIARECARQSGDLWIIYMGNNEMVGPFGAATVFGRQAPPLPYVRLATAIQRTRSGQLFTAWARKFNGHEARSTSWGGMQMFLNNQIAPDNPLKENVYRNFQKNLDDILRAGLGSGAKVLLNTVAVNLQDCPPFASCTNGSLAPADRAQFQQWYSDAQQAEAGSNFVMAARLCESAAKFDPGCAGLQYLWGRCLLAQNNVPAAREHLRLACDDDALPFRADSRLNGALRSAGNHFAGANLVLFDAAEALAADNATGVCGQETFYEHVHFDFGGAYRLGLAWAQQVEKMLPGIRPPAGRQWASPDECARLLGLTDWNRELIFTHMLGRMRVPPLSSQPNNAGRMEDLQSRIRLLQARLTPEAAATARENFQGLIQTWPDDFLLGENFALFLQASGNVSQSISEWRRIHGLMPDDYLPYFQMGRLLGGQQQWTEAESDLRLAVRLRPSLTEAWFELGNVLASQGKFDEALASYAVARRQRPQDPQTFFRVGKVYALLNRHPDAMASYREASRLDPGNWEPHFELGGELDAAGQLDAARDEFAAAASLNPANSRAHFNFGVLLAKQGRYAEAEREFNEALRLEPGYKNARDSLAKVRTLLQSSPKK
ncbi:MAG: tetratricopeptide repeat protein [Verrucomicrobiota bacterium]